MRDRISLMLEVEAWSRSSSRTRTGDRARPCYSLVQLSFLLRWAEVIGQWAS
jgi:hypothetical protein